MKWHTILTENGGGDIEMLIKPIEVRGIKIILLNLDKKGDAGASSQTFGIKKIECRRPGKAVYVSTCEKQSSESKSTNRWKVEEVSFINISFLIPYKLAKSFMEDVFEASVKLMRVYIEEIMRFPIIKASGESIRERIDEVLL